MNPSRQRAMATRRLRLCLTSNRSAQPAIHLKLCMVVVAAKEKYATGSISGYTKNSVPSALIAAELTILLPLWGGESCRCGSKRVGRRF